uniref:FHA domain-containing protein n=1 Tax=Cucumis melo TaxID=3656 RepID=A0A9I9D4S2_CUCME
MEIAGEDGSKLVLREPVTIFGRGSGFASKDRTISRRHILIEAKTSDNTNGAPMEPKVSFEVIGRNPIWVRSSKMAKSEHLEDQKRARWRLVNRSAWVGKNQFGSN